MKFDLSSDLHTDVHGDIWKHPETGQNHVLNWEQWKLSDTLVIAGDITNGLVSTKRVLEAATLQYKHVLFVDGNHDHYDTYFYVKNTTTNEDALKKFAKSVSKKHDRPDALVYLSVGRTALLEDVLFVGANGWYDWVFGVPFDAEEQEYVWRTRMADARYIVFPETAAALAKRDAEWLRRTIKTAQKNPDVRKIVVITHTSPLAEGLIRKEGTTNRDNVWNALNGSFGNSLMAEAIAADKNDKIALWCFGHTHYSKDFQHSGKRFVANPRGYPMEEQSTTWKPVQFEV